MAHYDNFAARAIDYNNEKLFEAFFDFFLHPRETWRAYLKHHRPLESGVVTLNPTVDDPKKEGWRYLAFLHLISGFLFRLIMLPLTAIGYTLSRTFLIVLNPFTAWRNNPWKTLFMSAVWAVPALLALNNHVYPLIPAFQFSTPFTASNFHQVSSVFGMPTGSWGIGASGMGGLIMSTFLAIGMACLLYLAKTAGKHKNAVEFVDPTQVHLNFPESVLITAPKNRPTPLIPLDSATNKGEKAANPYNEYNLASDNLRYMYYKEKKPAICDGAPKQVKSLLTAFNAVNAAHGRDELPVRATELRVAYKNIVRPKDIIDSVLPETQAKYRIDTTYSKYVVDLSTNTFKKNGVR